MSDRFWYAVGMGLITSASATFLGVITHNPNWPLNAPLGLIVGGVAGWFLWRVMP